MGDSNPPSTELLKSVLEPLLEDFQYWFGRSLELLENEKIQFMSDEEQFNLLQRVKQAQAELNTAKMLFTAANEQAGIDMAIIKPWHQLVSECWNVGMRYRQSK
ncbi:DUF2605 domain-containing protein [Trichormus variabilis]|uniref:DUF2605 domain-containing protein n=1 Tax=Trichormus variabilis SAG 1403-4b TaxID=447716 RepID=A0A3S1A455_ANAVA|nr:DUF2605 domain-containing protein [Trichormus variabilis]MBD2629474.1 DUF2605 domain-containing protein [Trichormus variabilis FACHB-164]RUS93058.1 hypothetical protein DSM107003_45980 [Trichormus variabilis SAG 1403-4b]